MLDTWEEHYDFLEDEEAVRLLSKLPPQLHRHEQFMQTALRNRSSGKAHYETIFGASYLLNSRLNIVPTKNMISNIGLGIDAVHTFATLENMPKGLRRVFFAKTYEIDFPLKHPKYVVCDMDHVKGVFRILGYGHYFVCLYRVLESRVLRAKKMIKRMLGLS